MINQLFHHLFFSTFRIRGERSDNTNTELWLPEDVVQSGHHCDGKCFSNPFLQTGRSSPPIFRFSYQISFSHHPKQRYVCGCFGVALWPLSCSGTCPFEAPCSFLQAPADWLTDSRGGRFVFGSACERLWQSERSPADVWSTPPPWPVDLFAPPTSLIDVCRCACLHDNGPHWRTLVQCLSVNHTQRVIWTPHVCVMVLWVYTLFEKLLAALLMALREGWRREQWQQRDGEDRDLVETDFRAVECSWRFSFPTWMAVAYAYVTWGTESTSSYRITWDTFLSNFHSKSYNLYSLCV